MSEDANDAAAEMFTERPPIVADEQAEPDVEAHVVADQVSDQVADQVAQPGMFLSDLRLHGLLTEQR